MSRSTSTTHDSGAGESGIWFVGITKPRQETRALENLERQGFECQTPLMRIQRRFRGEVVWRREAMFPRYVFTRPRPESAPMDRIRSTYGMSGLVRFAGVPATVADAVVKGLVSLAECLSETLFTQGQSIRLVGGPLAGLEGVFECDAGEGRAIVLLEFLQRRQRVIVATSSLAQVAY